MNGHAQGQPSIPLAWWSFDLGAYRACDGTYCRYPYETLPPLAPVSESLEWLGALDQRTDEQMAIHRNPPEARGEVAKIAASAARLGLTLPESFVRLMSDPDLQDRIPSCTACTFKLSEDLLPFPGVQGGHVVRFLTDQQDVLIWYLYFTPEGTQQVLVTGADLDEMAAMAQAGTLSEESRQSIGQYTWICAQSFAEFIYRWWLENTLWFKLDDNGSLTEPERGYLEHYRTPPNSR